MPALPPRPVTSRSISATARVRAVASVAEHPVIPFLRAGFNVGVNTDNRLMSDVMPSSEMWALCAAHDLGWNDVERLVTNAVASSFAPLDIRRDIIDRIVVPAYATLAG